MSAAAGSAHAATFADIDTDDSGDLNVEEFEAAFAGQGQAQEYFDMYNAPAEGGEADDVVTPEEITAYNSANYTSEDGSDPA